MSRTRFAGQAEDVVFDPDPGAPVGYSPAEEASVKELEFAVRSQEHHARMSVVARLEAGWSAERIRRDLTHIQSVLLEKLLRECKATE